MFIVRLINIYIDVIIMYWIYFMFFFWFKNKICWKYVEYGSKGMFLK